MLINQKSESLLQLLINVNNYSFIRVLMQIGGTPSPAIFISVFLLYHWFKKKPNEILSYWRWIGIKPQPGNETILSGIPFLARPIAT